MSGRKKPASKRAAAPERQSLVIVSHTLLDRLWALRPQAIANREMRPAFDELARLYMGVLELARLVDPTLSQPAVQP